MALFTMTVQSRRAAVRYRHGRPERVLEVGRHPRAWGARDVVVELRENLLSLAPQEVPTADGVSVKATAVVRWSVTDPVRFLEQTTDPVGHVYLATQVALRAALAGLTVEDLGRGSALPAAQLTAATDAAARAVGVAVTEVVVKDVIVPRELRAAAVEVAVARQRGLAMLEQARSETAALRSMTNAARLLDDHPALAQLRLVQAAPPGTQVVLQVGGRHSQQ
ncbi:SPFH domain-containing protein [Georgenia sp. SYP-B2076]|uniref:SPFH domain-containing protein n=1 Tax=Georgenia sp. SYP-B2076 TaxID=2495881 RepID=UPI000F8D8687|nr:SPFH domain-containing protein [Georgenia sp. SYP-B2076]